MINIIVLIIGILGVALIGAAIFLEETNRLGKNHKTFAYLNLVGNLFLLLYSIYNHVWLFTVLNSLLLLVTISGMIKVFRSK